MTTGSDWATVFANVIKVASGDYSAAIPLVGKLIDIVDERPAGGASPDSPDPVEIARARGATFLEKARREADRNDKQARDEAALSALEAFVDALAIAKQTPAETMRIAEIQAEIAACGAAAGDGAEGLHWMEAAYRTAFPLVLDSARRTAATARLRNLVPPLGDALIDARSKIGLIGNSELLLRWIENGPSVNAYKEGALRTRVERWKSGAAGEEAPPNLDWWEAEPDWSGAETAAASSEGSPASRAPASAPPRRREVFWGLEHAIRETLERPTGPGATTPEGSPVFNPHVEKRVRREALQAVAPSAEETRRVKELIAQRDATLEAGAFPTPYNTGRALLKEALGWTGHF
jgi:hypothetical protein